MIYNLNRGIGWASSGVEYAQMYRARALRAIGLEARFVFTDLFRLENITHMTRAIGFHDEEIIWLYSSFTDQKIAPSTYPLEELTNSFAGEIARTEKGTSNIRFFFKDRDMYVTAFLSKHDKNCVQRVETINRGCLLRRDYFMEKKLFSEYFAPKDGKGEPYERRWFHKDGTIAYTEVLEGDDTVYVFPDEILYSKERFIAYFMRSLHLTKADTVIIDRATDIGQAALKFHGDAKIGTIVHAEHYNESATTDDEILWNNYYEYEFSHVDELDFLVTSTDVQKDILAQQFRRYYDKTPHIVTIPVGSLEKLNRPGEPRKKHALITASRLASEKHIDWIVRAVIEAKKKIPDLSLDIYGKGGEEKALRQMIAEKKAEDYIRLMGHQDLKDKYVSYDAYVSASTSEGFGLTLMEAVGSGLPMICFDVHYGNVTFLKDGVNGFLVPYRRGDDVNVSVKALKEKIIRLFTQADTEAFSESSYEIASAFLEDEVNEKWRALLCET